MTSQDRRVRPPPADTVRIGRAQAEAAA